MLVAIFVVASWSVVNAQQPELPVEPPVAANSTDNKRKYLLEIYVDTEWSPSYLPVSGPKGISGWGLFGRFIRTSAEPESGRLPIAGVKVEPQLKGDAVKVRVSLFRGEQTYDEEELVHVYQLRLGEETTLSHLRRFGIQPFRVKVVEPSSPLPPIPDFQNFTKSIDVVSAKRLKRPLPAYKIILRNLSDKTVSALKVDVTCDGAEGTIAYPEAFQGRTLVEPGKTTDLYITAYVPVRSTDTYVPGTAPSYTINIRSVVFSDLSYEGELERACWFESNFMGKQIWLKRIIPFIDQELANSNFDDQLQSATQFKEKVAVIRFKVDESERNKASSVSPGCPAPAKPAAHSARGMKLLLLRELDYFIDKGAESSVTFKSWLEKKRAYYAAWLAKL